MNRLPSILWPLLGLAGAVALVVMLQRDPGDSARAEEVVSVSVETMVVRRTALAGELRAGGFLRAVRDVTISAERAGRVIELPVLEGARVKKGAGVARFDDTLSAANLRRARAVRRETDLSAAANAAEKARAVEALHLAEHEQALRHPASPIAGIVEVHHVDAGEFVARGTPLVDVIDASELVLDVDVDAAIVGRLAVGQDIAVLGSVSVGSLPGDSAGGSMGDSPGGSSVRGVITRRALRAGARTRRYRIEITIAAHGTGLLPGMHAEARFVLAPGAAALYVPKAAVREQRGEHGVFRVEQGVVRWIRVRVADVHARSDLWRVRDNAIADGDRIVRAGFSGLRNGVVVTSATPNRADVGPDRSAKDQR